MNYDSIAQRIVAQGVGLSGGGLSREYQIYNGSQWMTAKQFCHDWRVAGSMLQLIKIHCLWYKFFRALMQQTEDFLDALADPLAIVLATLEALEDE